MEVGRKSPQWDANHLARDDTITQCPIYPVVLRFLACHPPSLSIPRTSVPSICHPVVPLDLASVALDYLSIRHISLRSTHWTWLVSPCTTKVPCICHPVVLQYLAHVTQ